MHILMVSLDFPPVVGGISASVYELSKALIENGCKVSVITRKNSSKELSFETIEDMDIYRVKLKSLGFLYGYQIDRFIKRKIKNIKPDIIHIHGMRPLEFYSIKEIPLVYTNHTSGYLKRIKKGGYRIALLKRLFEKPDLFLAPSKELLEIPFKIRAKKVFISNGVVADKFRRDQKIREEIREKLKIKDSDILAILTRRLVWKNGVRYLALATKYIKNPNLKLLLIGDGEEYEEIEKILKENFKDRFFMLGSKRHDEIVEYYSAADISILPSLMEATSISGLEAMASSLAIVGTKVGGIPEIIKDGINGFLCEPTDPKDLARKIDKLLECNYVEMGKKGRDIVLKEFDWNTIAKRVIKEYKEIL